MSMSDESLEKKLAEQKAFETSPWCAYAPGKQEWKKAGGYYTAEELRKLDEDMQRDFANGTLILGYAKQPVIDAD